MEQIWWSTERKPRRNSWITADCRPLSQLDTGYRLSIFKHTWAACATENKSLRGHNMGQHLADSL